MPELNLRSTLLYFLPLYCITKKKGSDHRQQQWQKCKVRFPEPSSSHSRLLAYDTSSSGDKGWINHIPLWKSHCHHCWAPFLIYLFILFIILSISILLPSQKTFLMCVVCNLGFVYILGKCVVLLIWIYLFVWNRLGYGFLSVFYSFSRVLR